MSAVPGQQLEVIGDENVYVGDLATAKRRYGAAIDAYLRERYYDAAARACRKLIRLAPDVVRTHYTLAYLLVGLRRYEEAKEALDHYAQAVLSSNLEDYAIPFLTLLAYVTEDDSVRGRIGVVLSRMGTPREERGWERYEHILQVASAAGISPRERWERLLPIAIQNA